MAQIGNLFIVITIFMHIILINKGCFVPATKMQLGLMDKLYVKIHSGMFMS